MRVGAGRDTRRRGRRRSLHNELETYTLPAHSSAPLISLNGFCAETTGCESYKRLAAPGRSCRDNTVVRCIW
eukprot:1713648-Pleurochrysis_carterae.AAC.1